MRCQPLIHFLFPQRNNLWGVGRLQVGRSAQLYPRFCKISVGPTVSRRKRQPNRLRLLIDDIKGENGRQRIDVHFAIGGSPMLGESFVLSKARAVNVPPPDKAVCYPSLDPGDENPHLFVYHAVVPVSSAALAEGVNEGVSPRRSWDDTLC